jgi:TolB-like protein/tetratricopeptide (TPR) repeat protein
MPPSVETLQWLEKILASRCFGRSPRLSRFLRFLVENALEGVTGNLKEYAIGIDVFDRDPSYDPRLDPIVRVEARRLRQKLRLYYEDEGRGDHVRIEIPERGYLPKIGYVTVCSPVRVESSRVPVSSVSMAVLSLTSEPDVGSFANGVTDELIHFLSLTGNIRVIERHSLLLTGFGFGGGRGFGRQANVDYLLEASVRTENGTVRACIRLVNPFSGICLWSETYEMQIQGILAAQRSLASQITVGVQRYLRSSNMPLARDVGATNHPAHALYSEGRRFLNSRTRDGICQSVECFRQLINACPQFALAYAGLADAYSLGARYDVFPPQESWERARVAALDAVRIDYTLAEAHTSLAFVDLHYRRDWGSAEREFCTAILLNPRYAPARQWYGWLLAATGNPEMAIMAIKQAVRMDPSSPNANADLALAYYFSRNFDDAIAQCRRTLALYAGFYRAHQLAGMAHLQKRDFQSALEHLQSAATQTRGTGRAAVLLASALLAMGRLGEAHAVFTTSIEARNSKPSAIEFALFFAALGDLDSVFQWLERAYEEQDAELLWLSVDPMYDTVRHDPRFLALLSRIGKPAVTYRLRELVLAPYEEETSSSPTRLCTANAT